MALETYKKLEKYETKYKTALQSLSAKFTDCQNSDAELFNQIAYFRKNINDPNAIQNLAQYAINAENFDLFQIILPLLKSFSYLTEETWVQIVNSSSVMDKIESDCFESLLKIFAINPPNDTVTLEKVVIKLRKIVKTDNLTEFIKTCESLRENSSENVLLGLVTALERKLLKCANRAEKIEIWDDFFGGLTPNEIHSDFLIGVTKRALADTNYAFKIVDNAVRLVAVVKKPENLLFLFRKHVTEQFSMAFMEMFLLCLEKHDIPFKYIRRIALKQTLNPALNLQNKLSILFNLGLYHVRKYRNHKSPESIEHARDEFHSLKTIAEAKAKDNPFPPIYFHLASFYSFVERRDFKNVEKARFWLKELPKNFQWKVDSWTKIIEFEKNFGSLDKAKLSVQKALDCFKKGDKRESIVSEWKRLVMDAYEDVAEIENDMREIKNLENKTGNQNKRIIHNPKNIKNTKKIDKNVPKPNNQHLKVAESAQKSIKPAKKVETAEAPACSARNSTVFAVNLDESTSEKEINDLFKHYGKIAAIKMPKNDNNLCKGYAYITFKDNESAENAVKKLNFVIFKKQILTVQHSRSDEATNRTVFVKGLPRSDCAETLKTVFGKCGAVREIRRPRERNGEKPKPFCFLSFEEESSVAGALEMTGKTVDFGQNKAVLTVEKCVPTEKTEKAKNVRIGNAGGRLPLKAGASDKDRGERRPLLVPGSVKLNNKRRKTVEIDSKKGGDGENRPALDKNARAEGCAAAKSLSNEGFSELLK